MKQCSEAGEDDNKSQWVKPNASDAKVKFRHWTAKMGGGAYEVFSFSPCGKKRGCRTCWHPTNTEKGWMVAGAPVVGCSFFLFYPLPLTPYCLATLNSAPSVSWEAVEECVFVWVCVCVKRSGGGFLLKVNEVEPLALSPLLHPTPSPPHPMSPSSFLLGQRMPWMPGVSCSVK